MVGLVPDPERPGDPAGGLGGWAGRYGLRRPQPWPESLLGQPAIFTDRSETSKTTTNRDNTAALGHVAERPVALDWCVAEREGRQSSSRPTLSGMSADRCCGSATVGKPRARRESSAGRRRSAELPLVRLPRGGSYRRRQPSARHVRRKLSSTFRRTRPERHSRPRSDR
jgi:hypothetical protein